jgi:hypothetical protein
MAANSHTTAEYVATNTVAMSTAPMSHNTTNTTGTGSSKNLPYALAMGPADVCARARCSAPGGPVRRGWLLLRVVDSRRRGKVPNITKITTKLRVASSDKKDTLPATAYPKHASNQLPGKGA